MLDYGYIKNHYRLIPVDLSRQRELDADPKAIKQIKLVDCMFLSCHVRVEAGAKSEGEVTATGLEPTTT